MNIAAAKNKSRRLRGNVTLKDIARKYGVSMVTVSAALRGDRRQVCEETGEKIRKLADRMGYDPSATAYARRLRYCASSKNILNHVVGIDFAWDYLDSPYFARLFQPLGRELTRHGYSILTNWAINEKDSRLPCSFARGEVDGVFHISGTTSDMLLSRLREEPGFGTRPVVSIFESLPGCSNILIDDYSGGRQIAEHLVAAGHKSVFYLESDNYQHVLRIRGMKDVMRKAGLAGTMHPVFFKLDHLGRSFASMRKQFEAFPECSAIFCSNDVNAIAIYNWFGETGINVPQNFSVVGFDNTHELRDESGRNILTTVEIPLEEAGRMAAEMMISRIEGRETGESTLTLPVKLIPRTSVSAPAPEGRTRPIANSTTHYK